MRTLSPLVAALVAAAAIAPAQTVCNLGQPLTSANQGNVGGGIYFNLTVTQTVTFQSITYVSSDATTGTQSSFNMFVGPSTWVGNVGANPGPWILVAQSTPVTVTPAVDTVCVGVLNPAGPNAGTVTFPPGSYGVALQAVGHSWGYQNGQFQFGAPGGEFTVDTGGASNAFLTLATFSPRSINGAITYTTGGTPMLFAQREPYGEGCYRNFRSFYEMFPSSVFMDLGNTSMRLTYDSVNNRYVAIAGTTPVDTAVVTSPSLAHLNDENRVIQLANAQPIIFPNVGGPGIATGTVEMCSNGYVNLVGTAPPAANPTVAAWLNDTAARIGNWHNFDPTLGGTTHYDYDTTNAAHVFSWFGQIDGGITGGQPSTFQMAFFANGDVEFRWGQMSVACGGTCPTLVGFTPGNGAADPGTMDLSAALAGGFTTSSLDQPALALEADVNPVLSAMVNLTTSNVTGSNLGLMFVTLADLGPLSPAGLDLGFLGGPGCVANVDINAGVGNLISNLGSPLPGLTVPFPIPAGPPALIGQSFYCQSAWLDSTQNALGIITSNGLRLKIGAF